MAAEVETRQAIQFLPLLAGAERALAEAVGVPDQSTKCGMKAAGAHTCTVIPAFIEQTRRFTVAGP